MTRKPQPTDLVHLVYPGFNDSITNGVRFVDGRTADPLPRWRAQQVAACFGGKIKVEELDPVADFERRYREVYRRVTGVVAVEKASACPHDLTPCAGHFTVRVTDAFDPTAYDLRSMQARLRASVDAGKWECPGGEAIVPESGKSTVEITVRAAFEKVPGVVGVTMDPCPHDLTPCAGHYVVHGGEDFDPSANAAQRAAMVATVATVKRALDGTTWRCTGDLDIRRDEHVAAADSDTAVVETPILNDAPARSRTRKPRRSGGGES